MPSRSSSPIAGFAQLARQAACLRIAEVLSEQLSAGVFGGLVVAMTLLDLVPKERQPEAMIVALRQAADSIEQAEIRAGRLKLESPDNSIARHLVVRQREIDAMIVEKAPRGISREELATRIRNEGK